MDLKVKVKPHLHHHFKTTIKSFDPDTKIVSSTSEPNVFILYSTRLLPDEVKGFTSVEMVFPPIYDRSNTDNNPSDSSPVDFY